jgi:hypothetical protein
VEKPDEIRAKLGVSGQNQGGQWRRQGEDLTAFSPDSAFLSD